MIGLARVLPHMDGFAGPLTGGDEARLSAGHDAAVMEGRMAAEAQHALEVGALVESHRSEMQRLRDAWVKEQAAELAGAMLRQIDAAETRISNALASILSAFIAARLPEAARQAMTFQLAQAVRGDAARAICLRGPSDLTKPLAESLMQSGIEVAGQYAATEEIEASDGEFTAVTALQHWLAELGHG
jgi:hypothetical protein